MCQWSRARAWVPGSRGADAAPRPAGSWAPGPHFETGKVAGVAGARGGEAAGRGAHAAGGSTVLGEQGGERLGSPERRLPGAPGSVPGPDHTTLSMGPGQG